MLLLTAALDQRGTSTNNSIGGGGSGGSGGQRAQVVSLYDGFERVSDARGGRGTAIAEGDATHGNNHSSNGDYAVGSGYSTARSPSSTGSTPTGDTDDSDDDFEGFGDAFTPQPESPPLPGRQPEIGIPATDRSLRQTVEDLVESSMRRTVRVFEQDFALEDAIGSHRM
jgi:hypothetical protein